MLSFKFGCRVEMHKQADLARFCTLDAQQALGTESLVNHPDLIIHHAQSGMQAVLVTHYLPVESKADP